MDGQRTQAEASLRARVDALSAEAAGLRAAIAVRDEDLAAARAANAVLDTCSEISGLAAQRHQGETWREYRKRILAAFKDGAGSTLFLAIQDEIGRFERDSFVRAGEAKTTEAAIECLAELRVARMIRSRLWDLTGAADTVTKRERAMRSRAEWAHSDVEDAALRNEFESIISSRPQRS